MKRFTLPLIALFTYCSLIFARAQGTLDVIQHNISGSAPASALGVPFGQPFIPGSALPLGRIDLAVAGTNGVGDVQVSLYHTDTTGSLLLGNPITSGTISA